MSTIQTHVFCLVLAMSLAGGVLGEMTAQDYMKKCMPLPIEGASKETPSPEPGLECKSFRGNSCCNANYTLSFLENHKWYSFTDWVHCPQRPRLSNKCARITHDELCFFSCSPNLGPYLVKGVVEGWEDLNRVPICASQCDEWWKACKNEYTCHRDWLNDMNWDTGLNQCQEGSKCKKYHKVYSSAVDFCSTIWGKSYRVVPDDEPCMVFSFDPSKPNPNTPVAQAAAELKANEGVATRASDAEDTPMVTLASI